MNDKVKVLYIISTLKRTGPTNVLYNLISELDRKKIEPIILTLSSEPLQSSSLLVDFNELNVKVLSFSLSRIKGFFVARKRIKHIIYSEKIEVVHLFGFRPDFFVNKFDYESLKIISTINSNLYDDYTMLYGKFVGKVMAHFHVKSLNGKEIVACSEFVANEIKNRYGIRLKIIYNGVPKKIYYKTNENERKASRKKLMLPLDNHIYVFIGLLIYRKDPITVLKAFINSNAINNSILLIIGDGPLMDECKSLCFEHRRNILFLGNQPSTIDYLKASNFYISSSYSEGLPTSVMEAMGCGLPVILSNINPHKELVFNILNYDYSFPVNDYKKLADKIDKIAADDFDSISESCYKIISETINSEIMASEYQKLYTIN
ncbi:glycosyltransferase family 4 protein [Flavobacterium sp.]|uniref:glycosyltransferase family 4 protein n=1 Tax=Flavobacterium sp. TaxID=239 RepID=UPI001B73F998|nr:glycosyltransferase family 4 protein [Flavobacterium sp.]MBP6128158.1 glycosyltransferase family 4 protein [Flavobacterium sp.]